MKAIQLLFLISLMACAGQNVKKIRTEKVQQKLGGTAYQAQVFYPSNINEKKPAIIVVHEWWGHNDYARSRARQLAELGYVAMSIDMYGDNKTASHPKNAGEFAKATLSNPQQAYNRFNQAIQYLKSRQDVADKRIGAIGYCFGGTVVLNMARMGADLEAVASFHGGLGAVTDTNRKIDTKIAVFNGAADPMVTDADIKKFKQEMQTKDAEYLFKSYPGAKHAFTNPQATEFGNKFNLPLEYNAEADRKSWNAMKDFFAGHL